MSAATVIRQLEDTERAYSDASRAVVRALLVDCSGDPSTLKGVSSAARELLSEAIAARQAWLTVNTEDVPA